MPRSYAELWGIKRVGEGQFRPLKTYETLTAIDDWVDPETGYTWVSFQFGPGADYQEFKKWPAQVESEDGEVLNKISFNTDSNKIIYSTRPPMDFGRQFKK